MHASKGAIILKYMRLLRAGSSNEVSQDTRIVASTINDDDENIRNEIDADSENVEVITVPRPSGMDEDPDGIPTRFLYMCKGNRKAAHDAYANTLFWRKANDVDNVLNKPHPNFDICKAITPHYFPGHDVDGNIILVQRPGMLDLKLKTAANMTDDELVSHMVYVLEYCWSVISPPKIPEGSSKMKDGVMTSVLDMAGVNMRKLRKKAMMDFIMQFVSVMSAHYPQRSYKTVIINAPGWFGTVYRIFKPLLRESTRKKIQIYNAGPRQDKALSNIFGVSIPRELCGASDSETVEVIDGEPGPRSNVESELRDFCMKRLKVHGVEMRKVTPVVERV